MPTRCILKKINPIQLAGIYCISRSPTYSCNQSIWQIWSWLEVHAQKGWQQPAHGQVKQQTRPYLPGKPWSRTAHHAAAQELEACANPSHTENFCCCSFPFVHPNSVTTGMTVIHHVAICMHPNVLQHNQKSIARRGNPQPHSKT